MVQAPLERRDTGSTPVSTFTLAVAMLHVSALVLGNMLGNKSTELGPFIVTLTVLSFPVTFLTTDLLNEYCGRAVTRRVTFLALVSVALAFALIEIARFIPAAPNTHLPSGAFDHVLAVPGVHVIALLSGYGFGQLTDIRVFHRLRQLSGGRHLWMRVVGSTASGEMVDGLVVSAFLIVAPASLVGRTPAATLLDVTWNQAVVRMAIMVALLPLLYCFRRLVLRRQSQASSAYGAHLHQNRSTAHRWWT